MHESHQVTRSSLFLTNTYYYYWFFFALYCLDRVMTFICPNDTQDPLSFRPMPFKHALSLHRINYFGKLDSFDDSARGFDGGDFERALTICLRSEAVILI